MSNPSSSIEPEFAGYGSSLSRCCTPENHHSHEHTHSNACSAVPDVLDSELSKTPPDSPRLDETPHHSHEHNHSNACSAVPDSSMQQSVEITKSPTDPTRIIRSSLLVKGICCSSEVPQVTSILKTSSHGVGKVKINITAKMVYIDHNPDDISAADLAKALNSNGFGAVVTKDGGVSALGLESAANVGNGNNSGSCSHDHSHDHAGEGTPLLSSKNGNTMTKFVESTLFIPSLSSNKESDKIEALLEQRQLFKKNMIRAIAPNVSSSTVKIEHNPSLVSAQTILDALLHSGPFDNASILVDGGEEQLFLPMSIEMKSFELEASNRLFPIVMGLGLEVIISGIFWVVSMVGRFVDKWSYLQYAGLISVAFGIPSVAFKAFRTIRRFHFDANCMMVTAAFGSLLLQEYDEAASVSFLFTISEFLEELATSRATKALDSIIKMRPQHANLIGPNGESQIVPAESLAIGSLVSVRTGDQIPSDGVVVEGTSQIDESSLTGESIPVYKKPGDTVSGGTINAGLTRLIVETTCLVEDSAVSRLVALVEESAANTSPTEQLVDTFAKSYTPTVIAVAFLMSTIPWFFGAEMGRRWTMNGLIIVVIACPCALTISTPVTYAAGLAATAQKGIIVKGGATLEALGSVKTVVFDKTGTLTEGKFQVKHLDIFGTNKERREVLSLLSTMEAPSSHPLAAALINAARAEGVERAEMLQVLNHTILPGEGVTAIVDGEEVYVGNVRLFDRLGMYDSLGDDEKAKAEQWNSEGGTVGFLGVKGAGILGMFCVADGVRPEARSVISELAREGCVIVMLTGDGDGAAKAVAREVGVPDDCVYSKCLPEDKLEYVSSMIKRTIQTETPLVKKELLLFVGDGVNDGPALAAANIGVAMGEGAALAMEVSDVTLMDSKLDKLLFSIKMGTKVVTTVKENIAVSIAAKIVVIALTFAGKMTLLGAIASDVGVMLLVSINGMRLLPKKHDVEMELQPFEGKIV